MTSFLKMFARKLTGRSIHERVAHIEGAERVCVDSSVLCCPVCYEVYSSVPALLACGHTFCSPCIQTIQRNKRGLLGAVQTINCPMCCAVISADEVFMNYVIDDLLNSVEEIGSGRRESIEPTAEIVATLRLANNRAEKRVSALEARNGTLAKELQETKKQLEMMNLIVFSVVVGYFGIKLLRMIPAHYYEY